MQFENYFESIPEIIKTLFTNPEKPWETLENLDTFIKKNTRAKMEGIRVGEVYIDHDVWIGKGTVIEHGAMIKGPAIIGKNCEIRAGAYIRGNVFIDDACVIGHSTEIKSSIVMRNSNCGHFNYVGDSILGSGVNLGAGSVLANLRFDKKTIIVGQEDTGRAKLGSILGDGCQIGCNTVLNPGTIFEKHIRYAGRPLKAGFYRQEDVRKFFKA